MSAAFPTAESMANPTRYTIDAPESEAAAALLSAGRNEIETGGL